MSQSELTPLPEAPAATHPELSAWLRLGLTAGIGLVSACRLLRVFGQAEAIFDATPQSWRQVLSPRQCEALAQAPPGLADLVRRTQNWLDTAPSQQRRAVITLGDPFYPPAFLQLADPPLLIYVMGAPSAFSALLQRQALAVVGSRNPTPAGLDNAFAFSHHLAQQGVLIVSGLARGIDGVAHRGALQGGHSPATVAFVGTGLDRVYPQVHRELAQRIVQQGLLISEYPLGTPPLAANFPRRNRLIAALSQGVLVVEAGLPSGSLVTAGLSIEQGKEVFAIPGSIHSPASRGCHSLIKQGAKLVEKAQDIMDELPQLAADLPEPHPPTLDDDDSWTATSVLPQPILRAVAHKEGSAPMEATASNGYGEHIVQLASAPDQSVLRAMGHEVVDLDTLQARSGWATPALQAALMRLELGEQIARVGGGLFQRLNHRA